MSSEYLANLLNEIKPRITTREKYREDIIAYFSEVHNTTFPPKLQFFLEKMYGLVKAREPFDAIFKAPRGGGKSKMASAFEFGCWYILDAEAVNAGGSEEQARIVFEYTKAYIDRDSDAKAVAPETTQTRVTKVGPKPQPTLVSVPASPKSIRGKHPGGETKTAGMLVLDEMCEMEDEIITDALGMLRGAKPPIMICLSTFHKMFGKFQEFWDDQDNDFIKFDWDTFDICEECTYECSTCVSEIEEKYCKVVCDCYMDFEREPETLPKWFAYHYIKDEQTGEIQKVEGDIGKTCPECGGRVDHKARFAKNGWITIKEIRKSWKLYDLEKFEVDIMGMRPSGASLVLNPEDLKNCIVGGLKWDNRAYIRAGIDWGARGTSVLVLIQRFGDGRCEVIDFWAKDSPRDDDIYEQLKYWKSYYGLTDLWADQSHPFQNDNVKFKLGINVREVNFNTEKMAGVGVLKNYTEKRMLFIDDRFELLVKQLRSWHRDTNGNIKKVNDHACDALLCSMLSEAGATELISAFDERGGYIQGETMDPEKEYWSGYEYEEVGPVYGDQLDEYLDGEF